MKAYPLIPSFILSFVYLLLFPLFFPKWTLSFFAPFLVMALLQLPHVRFLFLALLAGVLQDLFSISTPFGFYSLAYLTTAFFIQIFKNSFFKDETFTYLLLTLIFTLLQTVLEALFAYFFKLPPFLSVHWITFNLILFPVLEIFYAWVFLQLPFYLIKKIKAYRT